MRKVFSQLIFSRLAAKIFAASLIFVWTSQNLPLIIAVVDAANDEACRMSCCHGLPRHSAKSCSGGACHSANLPKPEIICGAKELAEKRIAKAKRTGAIYFIAGRAKVPIFDESKPDARDDSPFVQKPRVNCETVACGANGSTSFNQQNQQRDYQTALTAFATLPRPPTATKIQFVSSTAFKSLSKRQRLTAPRAPPISFS